MKLIRKTRTISKNDYKIRYGIFWCAVCLQEVEKQISNGLKAKSCGCMQYKLSAQANKGKKRTKEQRQNISRGVTIHGGKGTKLYNVWNSMKQRCFNPKIPQYKDYGGRGIEICPEWVNDYAKFRDWALNNGYKEGLQINRIDNDGNYEPNNCNFKTAKENSRNRRSNVKTPELVIEIKTLYKTGKYTHRSLAKKFGISKSSITNIINNKEE